MTKKRWIGLAVVLVSTCISMVWGDALRRWSTGGLADFKGIYYPARCLLQHCDPYKNGEILRVYQAEGGTIPSDPVPSKVFRRSVGTGVNLPTTFFLIIPFALTGWPVAQVLWIALTAVSLSLAAFLVWDIAAEYAPVISSILIFLLLANDQLLFMLGNTAGLVVGLCGIAVWCFVKDRYAALGVACLSVSLAIKPHDSGFVWLFFLLAGGCLRKRALQTLAVTVLIAIVAAAVVTWIAPHWFTEMRANLAIISAPGDLNDPGVPSRDGRIPDGIVDLQAAISVFKNDGRVYDPISYLICAAMLVPWAFATVRLQRSPRNIWLGLAFVAAITMLPNYHRTHDAKLLLLTIPGCAMLWADSGIKAWIAFVLDAAGLMIIGDISLTALLVATQQVRISADGLAGDIQTVLLTRPAPIVLLLVAAFHLWMFLRRRDHNLSRQFGNAC